jgi:multidrug efflux pump subunit AcrB
VTLAVGLAIFLVTIGYFVGGHIKFMFFDPVEADNMIATLTMPQGTPFEQTRRIIENIEAAVLQAIEEFESKRDPNLPPLLKHISTTVGSHPAASRGGPGHSDLSGAVIGHVLMGYVMGMTFNLSILSLFGIVALSGVVVNDSIIMIDLINREQKSGIELAQVLRDCATRRFRPIMLTTLTTFCGLLPMVTERSLQARFLIPMAISLAFGVMFATAITLILVPSLYMILEDAKGLFSRKTGN